MEQVCDGCQAGLTVSVFKQGDDPIDAINHMMSLLSVVVTSCFPTTNNQLRNSSNPRQQATIYDGRVTVQPVQGRHISYATSTSKTYTPRTSASTNGKQRAVICYNCKGEGHISKHYTKPKRKRDDSWFKDKVLLVQAQANGQTNYAIVICDSEETPLLAEESHPILSNRPTIVEVPSELPKVCMEQVLIITTLKEEIRNLKGKAIVENAVTSPTIALKMYEMDVQPIASRLLHNRMVHSEYLRKTIALENDTPKPIVTLVYSRKSKRSKTSVPASKYKINKSMTTNNKEPSKSKESKVSNVHLPLLINAGTVKFRNDHVEKIMGFGDYQIGNVTISKVYYVKGFGHNLFSVGQFCDSNLEVAFCQHTCYVRNLEGPSVFGLCNRKSKKKTHKPKSEDTNQEKLYLLHMDLCGPMRVASINGKKYILVIFDGYSRFTWVKSKDEAPYFIIKFLKMIQVRLKTHVRRIRTNNGSEFVNQTLREYYETVGISHETSVARSPQQNSVVERRNRTLIKAACTMLIYAKALLFLWAEVVATAYLEPAIHEMTPATISSGLVPDPPSSTPFVPPLRTNWDMLFQSLFDELLTLPPSVDHPAPEVIALITEVVAPEPATSTGSPSSTTVDQDAPLPSNSQTTTKTQSSIIPGDVDDNNHDFDVAHMNNDPFFGILIPKVSSDQSSSTDFNHTVVHPDLQISEHNRKWTKDHPLDNIIGQLARPVSTRLQLHEQVLFYYYDTFLTSVEPKTYKDAFTQSCWIEAIIMDSMKAQRMALDEALVATTNRLKIGKGNQRLSPDLKSNKATIHVVLDALKLTLVYNAFLITASVLEIYVQEFWTTVTLHHTSLRFKLNGKSHTLNMDNFRDMLNICPRLPRERFQDPPVEDEILSFLSDVDHSGKIRVLTDVNVNSMHQPWRSFAAIIIRRLSGKTTSLDNLVYQVENKNAKKNNDMYFLRFTKVIIDFYMSKDQSISRRNKMFWHTTRDDPMFNTISDIKILRFTEPFSLIIPPKAKTTYKKKAKEPVTIKTASESVSKGLKLKTQAKTKQPAKKTKAKGLTMLTEAALSEADQLKLATKRSKKDFHISHASGSGDGVGKLSKVLDEQEQEDSSTDEGTDTLSGVLDVPKYESKSDMESWGDSDEEGDDNDDGNNDDEGDDDAESNDEQTESKNDDDESMDNEDDEEVKELYNDVNINLGNADAKMTDADQGTTKQHVYQEKEDAHVTLTH
uniref:Putative ribonuclease H-like domain-containing protein n=1 Tax=Tanacetum cinerariifolium TaxID=118510 RepID=A0A6L2J1A2_TANCI|nr:putative ribonuclease H-like domain-containing protein [Tanacetum cinerariifolium]